MPKLGKIQLFDSVYTHMYHMKDPATGRFSKSGKPCFDFIKERKSPDFAASGTYEHVKHSEMSSAEVKTGKAVSKLLYFLKHPKTAYYASLSALAIVAGAGAYIISRDVNKTSNIDSSSVVATQKQDSVSDKFESDMFLTEPDNMYVVQKGDNIWNINKNRIKTAENPTASNAVINDLTKETIKLNPDLKDEGNLIHVGDTIVLPPM